MKNNKVLVILAMISFISGVLLVGTYWVIKNPVTGFVGYGMLFIANLIYIVNALSKK